MAGDSCLLCQKEVKGQDSGLGCDMCGDWYHIQCVRIKNEIYKILQKGSKGDLGGVHWYCKQCFGAVAKLLKSVGGLQKRQDLLEEELETTKALLKAQTKEMEAIKSDLTELRNVVKQKATKEEVEVEAKQKTKDFSEIVKQEVAGKFEQFQDNLNHVQSSIEETKERALEEKDKESRINNIVLYRVKESQESKYEDRQREDKTFIMNLLKDMLEIECDEQDLRRSVRLGKRGENERPLLIELSTRMLKNRIMENLSMLRSADMCYRQLSITHDLTKKEREECKKLVEEAKQMQLEEESGEHLFRVRGQSGLLKIVCLRKY
jgi:hypothetical protein